MNALLLLLTSATSGTQPGPQLRAPFLNYAYGLLRNCITERKSNLISQKSLTQTGRKLCSLLTLGKEKKLSGY